MTDYYTLLNEFVEKLEKGTEVNILTNNRYKSAGGRIFNFDSFEGGSLELVAGEENTVLPASRFIIPSYKDRNLKALSLEYMTLRKALQTAKDLEEKGFNPLVNGYSLDEIKKREKEYKNRLEDMRKRHQ